MIALNEQINAAILSKYGTIAAFAQKTGIPYSTLSSIIKNGADNSKFSMILNICRGLDIDIFNNSDIDLTNNSAEFTRKLSFLDENGVKLVSSVIEIEYKRSNKF